MPANRKILERLEQKLSARGCSLLTISSYLCVGKKFLSDIKNKTPTTDDVDKYISKLRKAGQKDNSLRFNHYVISRLLKTIGVELDEGPPKIKEESVNRPIFTIEEVKKLVKNSKTDCDSQQKAFLAAATTWGLRRAEIVSIKPEDIKGDTILIRTKKSGLTRETLIPDEIKGYIAKYKWKDRVSLSRATTIFWQILYLCKFDLKKYNRYGWHSIRRFLVTGLMQTELKEFQIQNFLRWKVSGTSMLYRYTHIPPADIDKEIYEVHPALGLW